MPTSEMHPCVQQGREPDIACHDQHQPASPADPGQVPTKASPFRVAIMPQDNAGKAPWQPFGCVTRVGQTVRVGEQPKRRNPRSGPGGYGIRPGEEARVHAVNRVACATPAPVLTRPGP